MKYGGLGGEAPNKLLTWTNCSWKRCLQFCCISGMRHLGHENGRLEHVILTGDLRAPVGHGFTALPGDSSVTAKTLHHFTVIYSKLQLFTLVYTCRV